jgi:serine protease Do
MRVFSRLQAMALAAAVYGAALPHLSTLAAPPAGALEIARQLNEAFVDVADRCTPTVVVVQVAQKLESITERSDHPFLQQMPDDIRKQFEEYLQRQKRRRETDGPRFNGEGSGMILREDGYILTNAHVVEDAERIRVRLHDGREFEAEVRGTDRESDIAVLKLKESVPGLRAARFGNSDKVRVGEFAIAIGAPYELEYSVTFGHISAKGRAGLSADLMDEDFLQTDANINPGNSGGPLMNLEGEVIGVNSMIRGVGTGICFAIPANLAREVALQLLETGKFQRSWLGVGIVGIREDESMRRRYPKLTNGVVITSIARSGPAERAEVRRGDVVLTVDGRPVGTVNQLRREITRKRPGTDVALEVHRDGGTVQLKVQPDAMPDREERLARTESPGRRVPQVEPDSEPEPEVASEAPKPDAPEAHLGLTVRMPDSELVNQYHLGSTPGVVVTDVEDSSPLAEYGFRSGDLIYEVDKQPVKTTSQFAEAIRSAAEKKKFTLRYQRAGVKLSAAIVNEKPPAKPRK